MIPELICQNTEGGNDVRLYVDEFQTCKDGTITQLMRSPLGFRGFQMVSNEAPRSIQEENMEITYSNKRILIDEDNRGDNMSFILPTKVVMHDEKETIEMSITDQVVPMYRGSSETKFLGSFKILKADSSSVIGDLACYVTR
jgi:hypothetical protein